MADGIKNGAAPKAVTTYKEEESRRAFESGNATFMRNWPYAYALGKDSKIADKFDIATLPGFSGQQGAGVLGGYNLGISAYSKNPEGSARVHRVRDEPDSSRSWRPRRRCRRRPARPMTTRRSRRRCRSRPS